MTKHLKLETYLSAVRLQGGIYTALPVTLSGTSANLTVGGNLSVTGTQTFTGATTLSGNTGITGTLTVTSASGTAITAGPNGATNPAFKVDASAANSVTGVKLVSKASGSGAFIGAISSATNEALHVNSQGSGAVVIGDLSTGGIQLMTATAVPAGGSSTASVKMSSTATLGIYFGSGAPTVTAAQGSLYMRTDGSSTSTRLYVNTDGATTWTNVTTAA